MLANHAGVPIIWGPFGTAATDLSAIYLPDLPLEGRDLARYVYGYVVHECGHIRFTSRSLPPMLCQDPVLKHLFNVLEDPRIERAMCQEYLGAKLHLTALTEALTQDGAFGEFDPNAPLALQLRSWIVWRTNVDLMGYECLRDRASRQDDLMRTLLPAPLYAELVQLLGSLVYATSSEDVLDIAQRILAALHGARRQPADHSVQGPGKTALPAQGTERPAPDADDASCPQLAADEQGASTPALLTDEQVQQLLDAGAWAVPSDRGDLVRHRLPAAIAQARAQAAAAGRENAPVHMPLVAEMQGRVDGSQLIRELRGHSVALRFAFEEALQDLTLRRVSAAANGRRLLRDASVRVLRGSHRVFRKWSESVDVDAHVVVLLDASDSMRSRLGTAAKASLLLAMALEETERVRCTVALFPYEVTLGPSRDPFGVRVLKSADESIRDAAGRVSEVRASGTTPLASALLYASGELGACDAGRKVVLVVTDGRPDRPDSVRQVMAFTGDEVEYLGIGIGRDLGDLFPTFVRINDVGDLPSRSLELVRAVLLARDLRQAA